MQPRDAEGEWRDRARRTRWRLRGAWMWPVFGTLTLVDAVLLGVLPPTGDGLAHVPALLLAGVLNLVAVAVAAPLVGLLIRRRRTDLPRVVATDYAGTGLLVLLSAGLVALGVAHRPERLGEQRELVEQAAAVRGYVATQAPAEYRARLHGMNTLHVEGDLYRTCVPGRDPQRWLCLFVDTASRPLGVTLDGNRESNASFDARGGSDVVPTGTLTR